MLTYQGEDSGDVVVVEVSEGDVSLFVNELVLWPVELRIKLNLLKFFKQNLGFVCTVSIVTTNSVVI